MAIFGPPPFAGCSVRNNPYTTAPRRATSTNAAIFCVFFMASCHPHPILMHGENPGALSFLHLQVWNLCPAVLSDLFSERDNQAKAQPSYVFVCSPARGPGLPF